MAAGRTECDHRPILSVRTARKFREVQSHDMPARNTLVWDVGGDGGMAVHGKGGNIPRLVEKSDPLPRLQSVT